MLATLWAWALASPLHATIALGVLAVGTAIFNACVRYFTSPEWEAFCAKHPRIAGLFLIAKGLYPEASTIARGLLAVATGKLRERAEKDPAQ